MKFQQGHKKTGGRKAGTLNKATIEIKEFARGILEDPIYQKGLRDRVIQGKAPQIEILLFHYAYGKPAYDRKLSDEPTLEQIVNESLKREAELIAAGKIPPVQGRV